MCLRTELLVPYYRLLFNSEALNDISGPLTNVSYQKTRGAQIEATTFVTAAACNIVPARFLQSIADCGRSV